ncbi:MAG: helix-turn-helix domain-containing protein, partial [Alphaproteobacteria bacterium]
MLKDRRETARLFRARLDEAMERSGIGPSALAQRAGVDRSTLSQLLSSDNDRLPRADTVAAIAVALQVSLDWLLGLSREAKLGADILHESVQITPSARSPVDEGLERWQEEAVGYKIRYVPASLPDLVKTDEVLRHEFSDFVAKTTDQAIAAKQSRLDYTRLPETDTEICTSTQGIQDFADGAGIWTGLPVGTRLEQLDQMIVLFEELYPTLRMYLFDGRTHYSVPYTVFGPLRAAIYIGQAFFVFNTTEHIRVLTRHFDELIRAAVVQASEA